MSRITGTDAYGLMEAYQAVYAPQEEIVEDSEQLDEAEYSAANIRASQAVAARADQQRSQREKADAIANKSRQDARRQQDIAAYRSRLTGQPAGKSDVAKVKPTDEPYKSRFARPKNAAPGISDIRGGKEKSRDTPGADSDRPATTPSRPTAAPARPAAAPTKPATASAAPTKPAGSAMDQWAKANSKLAAASAEKARIRGTQQTDNPLMKDMRSRLPMNSPSVQSPDVAKLGKDGKGNQSLVSNPNAFKAATPTQAIKAAPSTSPAASGSVAPATAAIAAKTTQPPVAPRQTAREKVLNQSYEYDAYDLVLEYLLSQGHTDTVEEAHYVMLEMDAETIGTIVEAAADQSDKQIDKGVKTTYKAQNVIDNQHQGRSRGLNRLPANERAAKSKRMQGRLKARRDDLFGERNKREDSRRDELKKMLGL